METKLKTKLKTDETIAKRNFLMHWTNAQALETLASGVAKVAKASATLASMGC